MRNHLRKAHYFLFALFISILTGCGASNLAGTSSNDPGSITAKVVIDDGKSTAKSVGLLPAGVSAVRFKVTGPYTDPVAQTRYTTTKATFPAAAGGGTVQVSPGTGLIVTVQALGDNDVLLYEGFVRNVAVTSGATTDLGTVTLTPPYVKSAEVPCLGCHEDSRAADGNNLVAEYKGSKHYTRTVSPSPDFNGMTYADSVGCAGCHTQNHKDLNPAESGRCADCHSSAGNPPNFQHAQPDTKDSLGNLKTNTFGNLKNMCVMCHNPHTTALLTPTTGMAGCVTCHSVPQNQGAGYVQDNNGVRAITGEFNKWSHHVTGVNLNDAHCLACHLEGTVVDGKPVLDTTKHMANATVRLRNVDTDAEITWDPAQPSFTNLDNFCMNCHDANGATSPVSAKIQAYINTSKLNAPGKTASPTNPFGDTISNQYDEMQRPAVVDVSGLFDTANNSHHAVKGKRYSGRTRATVANKAAFVGASSAALPSAGLRKTIFEAGRFNDTYVTLQDAAGETNVPSSLSGRNAGVIPGDDSTLHCGDCHTVGQYRAADVGVKPFNKAVIGAHGSNNEYLLRNNLGTDQRHIGIQMDAAGNNLNTSGVYPYLVCYNCHKIGVYTAASKNNGLAASNARGHAGSHEQLEYCNGPFNTRAEPNGAVRIPTGTYFGVATTTYSGLGEDRLKSIITQANNADGTASLAGGAYGAQTTGHAGFLGNIFGIQCANCHNSGPLNGFGGIHGSKVQTYTDGMGNTTKAYRFMPGLGNVMFVPGVKGGVTGGSLATFNSYSGNRNGTGAGNTTGQTYTKTAALPENAIFTATKGYPSFTYRTGGTTNDANWEQWKFDTQKDTSGVATAMGCYTIAAEPFETSTRRGMTGIDPNNLQAAAGYDAKGADGRVILDNWGGCEDHGSSKAGADHRPVRGVIRPVTY